MGSRRAVVSELLRLGLYLVLALVGGAWLGYPAVVIALVLLGLLGRHLWYLHRLSRWLESDAQENPAGLDGGWAALGHTLYQLRKRCDEQHQRLSRTLERSRQSVAAMPDGTVVLDRHDRIEWTNRSASRLLGLRVPLDIGSPVGALVRDPDFLAYLKDREAMEPVEFSAPRHAEQRLSVRLVPFAENRRLMLVRDITQQQRMELTHKDFVANVSHELRTPLTVLGGDLETLQDHWQRLSEAQIDAVFRRMGAQTGRMGRLVQDLLSLSRLEAAEPVMDPAPVNMPALVEGIGAQARVRSAGKCVIVCRVDQGLWLRGQADPLESVVSNLLDNALAYTPEGGQITLGWWRDEHACCFEVQDTGEGVREADRNRLTERFFRVSRDRAQTTGGTGLGLSIVKQALVLHGARLRIDSELGVGSRFRCEFPLDLAAPGGGERGAGADGG